MNDFVTLSCPSCGGKLNVSKNAPTYVCEYCGQTHKLREEDIESIGRCPKCHRNDRVEKLTAIANKHDPLSLKFRPPENLKVVRYHRLLDSIKKEKPLDWISIDENQKSMYSVKSRLFGIGAIVAFVLASLLVSNEGSGFLIFLGVIAFLGCFALLVLAIIHFFKAKQDLSIYKSELSVQKDIQTKALKKRYDEVYYCQRDDLLFIPGEDVFASSSDYEHFITQVLETNKIVE